MKSEKLRRLGITLVEIPCWWLGDKERFPPYLEAIIDSQTSQLVKINILYVQLAQGEINPHSQFSPCISRCCESKSIPTSHGAFFKELVSLRRCENWIRTTQPADFFSQFVCSRVDLVGVKMMYASSIIACRCEINSRRSAYQLSRPKSILTGCAHLN